MPPKVAAQVAAQAPNMRERLLDYVSTPGPRGRSREIRWLIAEWGFGPPVVVLDPSLSWQRAGVAPLFAYLDRDRQRVARSGGNRRGRRVAASRPTPMRTTWSTERSCGARRTEPPVLPFAADHPLWCRSIDATDWDALARRWRGLYGAATREQAEVSCVSGPADATLRVDFGASAEAADGSLARSRWGRACGSTAAVATATDVITLDLGAEYVEFSAAECEAEAATADVAATQIAVGAAIDGNPLLRLLDARPGSAG